MHPRFAGNFRDLWKSEGAGNAGCALHPRSRAQRDSGLRARAYRAAENTRHSLRNGFTAYNALSPVSRSSLATVAPEKLIFPELDASISGVRTTRLCRTLSHRSLSALPASTAPRPTFVAIMIRPSDRDGMAIDVPLFALREKRNIFYFGA